MLGANVRPTGTNNNAGANTDNPELSSEELDAARTREITAKAVSGIMLLLLKWLKLSRESIDTPNPHNHANRALCRLDILKFEFLTQLLLDCNYMPLVLKLFLHQDVQQVVENKTDHIENR